MINKTANFTLITAIFFFFILSLSIQGAFAQTDSLKIQPGSNLYGIELDPGLTSTSIAELTDKDTARTLQIEGKVSEVCQNMGCWMIVTEGNISVRVLTKHKFFMPKDCAGSYAVVQGVFKIKEVSPEEQMHYLEEIGKKPDQPITESKKELRIEATGVKLTSTK